MSDNAMSDNVFLRQALAADIPVLEALLNRCYRFDEGWTNEAELVGGIRTNKDELKAVINDDKQYLFVYPQTDNGHRDGEETGELLGCINVEIKQGHAYIGMFAVLPKLQGSGVGTVMLQAAETFAQRHLSDHQALIDPTSSENTKAAKTLKMLVRNGRPKMLAYYQRRGYVDTGNTQPFLEANSNSDPNQEKAYFIEIAKPID